MSLGYYNASYNDIDIDFPKIGLKQAIDYGQSGLGAIKIIETITIEGLVQPGDLKGLSIPGKKLYYSVGNLRYKVLPGDDIEGGPKPELSINRQVGQNWIFVTLTVTVVRKDSDVTYRWYPDVVEIDVNYAHDIDERGLSTWTTTGTLTTRKGTCADKYREQVIKDYAASGGWKKGDGSQPSGDFVREAQTFRASNRRTKMTFTVKDIETWHSPAKDVVHSAVFTMSATTDGTMVTKKAELTIQPLKTPSGINQAKVFATAALHDMLFEGLDGSNPIFDSGDAALDSKTGEIKISGSIKVMALADGKETLLSEPTAKKLVDTVWWGITTKAQLRGFVSGKRPGWPRGYSGRSACKPFVPKPGVIKPPAKARVWYKFTQDAWSSNTVSGKKPVNLRGEVKAQEVVADRSKTYFQFTMQVAAPTSARRNTVRQILQQMQVIVDRELKNAFENMTWSEYPVIFLDEKPDGSTDIWFGGVSNQYTDPPRADLEAAILETVDLMEAELNTKLPVVYK